MTLPSEARLSFERTNAPPLPGLTCWNSRILKTVPSISMWLPFLNWLVEITMVSQKWRGDSESSRGGSPEALSRSALLDVETDWSLLSRGHRSRKLRLEEQLAHLPRPQARIRIALGRGDDGPLHENVPLAGQVTSVGVNRLPGEPLG